MARTRSIREGLRRIQEQLTSPRRPGRPGGFIISDPASSLGPVDPTIRTRPTSPISLTRPRRPGGFIISDPASSLGPVDPTIRTRPTSSISLTRPRRPGGFIISDPASSLGPVDPTIRTRPTSPVSPTSPASPIGPFTGIPTAIRGSPTGTRQKDCLKIPINRNDPDVGDVEVELDSIPPCSKNLTTAFECRSRYGLKRSSAITGTFVVAFDGNRFGDRVITSAVSGSYISSYINEDSHYRFLDDLRNYANRSSLFRTAFSIGAVAWIRCRAWGYYCSLAQGRISVAPTEELAVRDLLPKQTNDVVSRQAYITRHKFYIYEGFRPFKRILAILF